VKRRAFFIRNLEAWAYLEIFLITAVISVLGIRLILELAGYPKLGGGRLHIAHMLWGGLLMLAAMVILLSFLSRTAHRVASALGGFGFGAFIDEMGKVVAADNNYFFAPAVSLIYITFILTVLAIHAIRTRREYSDREYLVNALRELEEFALHGLDEDDRERVLLYLENSDPAHPLVPAIGDLVKRVDLNPSTRPGFLSRLRTMLRETYRRAVRLPGFPALVVAFFIAQLLIGLSYVIALLFLVRGSQQIWRISLLEHSFRVIQNISFVDTMQLASFALSSVFTLLGVLRIRRSRLRAFEMFERSLFVSILLTQVFSFYKEQFSALMGLIGNVVVLITVRFVLEQERLATVMDAVPIDKSE
jgi:hypothetical protein